jgi:hypothetical protein
MLRAPFEDHQVLRISGGQRPQQHCVNFSKDRGVRSDAKRKGEDNNRGKARRSAQYPRRVAKILQRLLNPQQRTFIAMSLLCLLHSTIGALRRKPRSARRHPSTFKILGKQGKMRLNLAGEFLLIPAVAEQAAESGN